MGLVPSSTVISGVEVVGSVPLSVAELRRLFWRLIWQPRLSPMHWLTWSAWRRRHQAIAQFYHHKRRALVTRLRDLLIIHPKDVSPECTVAEINSLFHVRLLLMIPLLWLSTTSCVDRVNH